VSGGTESKDHCSIQCDMPLSFSPTFSRQAATSWGVAFSWWNRPLNKTIAVSSCSVRGIRCWFNRTVSRMTRFTRFLFTADPADRPTATPNWYVVSGTDSSTKRYRTRTEPKATDCVDRSLRSNNGSINCFRFKWWVRENANRTRGERYSSGELTIDQTIFLAWYHWSIGLFCPWNDVSTTLGDRFWSPSVSEIRACLRACGDLAGRYVSLVTSLTIRVRIQTYLSTLISLCTLATERGIRLRRHRKVKIRKVFLRSTSGVDIH